MFIKTVSQTLQNHGVAFAVVGGYAVALHGAVRGTVDLDLVLNWNRDNVVRAITALQSLGFISRLPLDADTVFTQRDNLIHNKNLIAWHFYNPHNQAEQIDLIIDYDLADHGIKQIDLQGTRIPVLEKQDLIRMKEKSARPQDLADIDALRKLP